MRQTRSQGCRLFPAFLLVALTAPTAFAADVRICTPRGVIELELDERNAPQHARNFSRYVESGYYSGTVIHRAVPGSMIQGGSYDLSLQRRRPGSPVANESVNGLSNLRGTIAASRSDDPNSATSQFFINLADNPHLDGGPGTPGYTVFGRVTAGLDVLDAIAQLPTRQVGELAEVPYPLIELESVSLLERESVFGLAVEPDPATLQAEFNAARSRADGAAQLNAVAQLREACVALSGEQYLAEAEALIERGQIDRGRYSLDQFLAHAAPADPLRPRAQRLYAGLPAPATSNVEQRLAHCNEPSAPSIPDGRTSELASLQTIETEVRRYRQQGEVYLACVAREIDSGNLSELEVLDATERYNAVVIELTATATRFNEAVSDFKANR